MREYGSESAAARAMDYSFLLGNEAHAWQVYAEASTHPDWSLPRWAAVFGTWLKGGSERDMFEKALQQTAAGAAREHLVFMMLFLDKLPSDEAMEMLRQVSVRRDSFSFLHVASGIQAFRRRDFPALLKSWSALNERLTSASLRQDLLSRPRVFVGTMTEKMLTYALGRGLEYYDMPAVRKIVREAEGQDYRFSTLVMGIAKSMPFQMRRAESQ